MILATGIVRATKSAFNFVRPFLNYRLLGKVAPVLAGYKITHKCNLTCRHCPYWRRNGEEQGFAATLATLQRLRRIGIRILIFEGGEPLLWREGGKTFCDVAHAARKLFPSVCVTTNGTAPVEAPSARSGVGESRRSAAGFTIPYVVTVFLTGSGSTLQRGEAVPRS